MSAASASPLPTARPFLCSTADDADRRAARPRPPQSERASQRPRARRRPGRGAAAQALSLEPRQGRTLRRSRSGARRRARRRRAEARRDRSRRRAFAPVDNGDALAAAVEQARDVLRPDRPVGARRSRRPRAADHVVGRAAVRRRARVRRLQRLRNDRRAGRGDEAARAGEDAPAPRPRQTKRPRRPQPRRRRGPPSGREDEQASKRSARSSGGAGRCRREPPPRRRPKPLGPSEPPPSPERTAEIYVLRQGHNAPLAPSKIVPIRPGAFDASKPQDFGESGDGSVELSKAEREAFREIARALVGRAPASRQDAPPAAPRSAGGSVASPRRKRPRPRPRRRPPTRNGAGPPADPAAVPVLRNALTLLDRLPLGVLVARDAQPALRQPDAARAARIPRTSSISRRPTV